MQRPKQAPKQVWKLGEGEELLPDGSVLCPGSRRSDGSFRKASRRKKGYYSDEDLQRNVYKPNPIRLREAGLNYVVGLGMTQNLHGRKKGVAQEKKDDKRRRAKLKASLKHTLIHLIRPFCVDNQQPDRFFAFRVAEKMCKGKNMDGIEDLVKQTWQMELFDNFEKTIDEIEKQAFAKFQKQALRYLYELLHEIECWKIRQSGGVDLNEFRLRDLKDEESFHRELKQFEKMKAKPRAKAKLASSAVSGSCEEEVKSKVSSDQAAPSEDPKKVLKKLRKRLRQIEKLETKQANGKSLNEDQVAKLKSKDDILRQISSLENT